MRRIIDICWRLCKQVPLLPITILSAIPLALLGEWKPWGEAAWDSWISQVSVDGLSAFNPGVGQWIVIALVAYTIVVTVRGMIDDLRHGHVGVDLLAVVAIASTVAVQEYWAAWAVVLMISSGEAIEEFAQSKAESNLTALIDAAPRTAHVVVLPGMRGHVHASGSEHTADVTADGFRAVRVSDSGETDNQDGEKRAFASESPETDTKGASQTYDAAGERFETVPVDQVQLGDVILVLPGETVPVDGELLSGVATLDLSNINGEPVPREVYAGARVMSGAVNGSTTLTMRATQLAHDSQYQKILELVSSAQESRPRCREDRGYACSAVYRAFACDCWDCMGDFRIAAAICASIGACYAVSAVDCRAGRICGWNRATCQSGNPDQSAGCAGKSRSRIAYFLRQNRHAYRQAAAGRTCREAV